MLESLFDRPIIAVNDVRQLTGTTYAAANGLVARLVDVGRAHGNDRIRPEPALSLRALHRAVQRSGAGIRGSGMSQFAFLQREWPAVFDAAARAEAAVHADPRTACFYARRALELAVRWAYKHDAALKLPYQDNLSALIHEPSFKQAAGEAVFSKARVINTLGNRAVHSHRAVPAGRCAGGGARAVPRRLLARAHLRARRAAGAGARLRPDRAAEARARRRSRPPTSCSSSKRSLRERDEKLAALLADKTALDEELKRLRAEVAEAKKAAAAQPDTHDYSEAETRDYFIDLLLKEAGWPLDQPRDREFEVSGHAEQRGQGLRRLRALGRRRQAARAGRGQAHPARPARRPAAGEALRRLPGDSSSASGRSSSTPTATSTGSGTTRTTRRARCRASTRRPSWSC